MPPITKCCDDIVNNNNDSENDIKDKVFPYKICPVDENINREMLGLFQGEKTGFVQVGPKKWFFPSGFEREVHNYYNFKARPDDVFIVTFPRSGTTWTQEMVWLIANALDYQTAAKIPLTDRCPFLEFSCFVHPKTKAEFLEENKSDRRKYELVQLIDYPGWKYLSDVSGRRFIKTHLPFDLLPPNILEVGCKVIYVARNPKDVAVSFYHLNRSIRTQGYIGNFQQYWNYFEKNLQPWAPYWEHIKEAWKLRNQQNMLFLFYEDMKKDLRSSLVKISEFFDKSYSEEQYNLLEEHLRFDNFKNNYSVNSDVLRDIGVMKSEEEAFIRVGKNGGWRSYFDDELNARADRWIVRNLQGTDLQFPNFSV